MTTTTSESLGRLAWRRLRKNRGAVISMIVLAIMITMALAAPFITPFDPTTQILEYSVQPAGFRGKVIFKRNLADANTPSILAVSSYREEGDSVFYTDPAGEPYRIARSALVGTEPHE